MASARAVKAIPPHGAQKTPAAVAARFSRVPRRAHAGQAAGPQGAGRIGAGAHGGRRRALTIQAETADSGPDGAPDTVPPAAPATMPDIGDTLPRHDRATARAVTAGPVAALARGIGS